MSLFIRAATLLLMLSATSGGLAEQKEKAAVASPAPPALSVTVEQALYLIRSTLLTLNDANRTGNYTVLRDLAAPSFQAKNTAADLAQVFSDLRRRNFDLFSVALAAPQLSAPPALDGNGMLRLHRLLPDPAAADQFRPLVPERRRTVAAIRHLGRNPGGCGAATAPAPGRGAEGHADEVIE